jgi:hypothetical protein
MSKNRVRDRLPGAKNDLGNEKKSFKRSGKNFYHSRSPSAKSPLECSTSLPTRGRHEGRKHICREEIHAALAFARTIWRRRGAVVGAVRSTGGHPNSGPERGPRADPCAAGQGDHTGRRQYCGAEQVREDNPLYQDPLFREFFNVPLKVPTCSENRWAPGREERLTFLEAC